MTAELCAAHPDPDIWWADDLDEAWRICRRCPALDGCERGQEIALIEGVGFLLDGIPEPVVEVLEHSRSAYNAKAHGDCAACARRNAEWVAEWRRRDVTEGVESVTDQLSLWEAS